MKPLAITTFSVATTFFALSAGVMAFGQSSSPHLTPGYAELHQSINTKSAMPGEILSAKLVDSIQIPEGMRLPEGTEIMGHVDQVQASNNKSAAMLTLTFDKAQLKDGKVVPIKATLIEVDGPGQMSVLPNSVASDDKFDQQLPVSGETLHSAVQGNDSGTLRRTDRNISLETGSRLLLAVGPASSMASGS